MLGQTVVKRTVTNVGTSSATYHATAVMGGDITANVNPATLTLAPGQSANFTVTLVPAATTPRFTWEYGSLTWTDGTHVVRSPMQVNLGAAIAAPKDVSATTVSGSRLITITSGFSGKACAEGLREGGHTVIEYDVKRDLRALVDFLRPAAGGGPGTSGDLLN